VDGWTRLHANLYKDLETLKKETLACMSSITKNAEACEFIGYDLNGVIGNRDLSGDAPLLHDQLCLNNMILMSENK
jgi:hypothetical protein